jgi:hypothetical protein
VAKLADAPDLKSPEIAVSTTSEAYRKLPKKRLKPATGAGLIVFGTTELIRSLPKQNWQQTGNGNVSTPVTKSAACCGLFEYHTSVRYRFWVSKADEPEAIA